MKSGIGFLVGVIGLIFSLSALNAADEANLLVNGDLQDGGDGNTPGWTFSNWNLKEGSKEAEVTKWGIVAEKGNDANKCLWIGLSAPAKSHVWFQQEIKCDPSETYTLSFRAKGMPNDCGFFVCGAKNEWLLFESIKGVETSAEWKTYTASIKTPAAAARLGIRLGFGIDGQYEVFFDDVKLVKGNAESAK